MGRKKIRTTNISVDDLCDLVNDKYGLRPSDIGSVEHHTDMTENSIVQVCNDARGVKQLFSGSDPVLKKYLRNILDDKTILNFWSINY